MSSQTPPNSKSGKEPRQLSNELRMVIAFVLMGLILVATPFVYRKLGIVQAPPAKPPAQPAAGQTTPPPPSLKPLPEEGSTSAADKKTGPAVSAADERTEEIDTPLYHVVFSNRG